MNSAATPLAAFRLDGQVAAVTGGARGIGRAAAAALAAAGAAIAIFDRDAATAETTAQAIAADGASVSVHAVEVADEAALERAFDTAIQHHGGIDILVNSAGIALRHAAVDHPLADWDKVVGVNLTGVFLCSRIAARNMIRRGGGAIVNLASIMGFSGGGLYPNVSYQATKGAVVNMTRALAVEWAQSGIRVNAVAPTWVRTDLTAALIDQPGVVERIADLTPMRRLATPEEIAHAILFLASPAAAMITGHTLPVDGGFLAQ
ncbi:MAG TPA: SDR family oxidoreductase [Stellaceae bacterium]|jgi:NAD(P)-dependent dehydrogenase (short-subunit alcohol dehydrogenase family)|nr:SDR family oxidoreductase [Stellaceae bacterium]